MRFKDLGDRRAHADEIPDTYYGTAWSGDGSALFYITVNDAWRPYRVWRHMVGTPATEDVLVYQEDDEKFNVGVGLSRSKRYLMDRLGQLADQRGPAAGRGRLRRGSSPSSRRGGRASSTTSSIRYCRTAPSGC